MHDDDVRLRPLGALAAEAVIAEVFAHGWEKRFAHPLELHPQHVHHRAERCVA